MPAYNFQKRFVSLIENGEKHQTIRKIRRSGNPKTGSDLFLYQGLRTKQCRLIRAVSCTSVSQIIFTENMGIMIDDKWLYSEDREKLAVADGFTGFEDFRKFFSSKYELPFTGLLIEW
ncbi:MAG: ASCH domain-containing protein [Dehalococcoidia bacterium]|jgi:hypothetical protein